MYKAYHRIVKNIAKANQKTVKIWIRRININYITVKIWIRRITEL
jgi:hypothetical protein